MIDTILADKRIVVTGGTGSMGKTLVQRLLNGEMGMPQKVIVFSRDEAKQHQMRQDYLQKAVATDEIIYRNYMNVLEFRIGDVRNYADVCGVLRDADVVINAAALKQVPTCEYFPEQAILTNCVGAMNIVRAISEHDYPVETVVAISTDKAAKPINVMGMTKALQERIFLAANVLSRHTRYIGVRYGNVLASRGSVIPLFHDQIKAGGPLTITVPEMTRFLLSIDQAVDTVFAALCGANPGEIYVPNAPAATVENIAQALIGDRRIEIRITGIRPGEKMHEIMVSDEESYYCVRRGAYYAIMSMLPELQAQEVATRELQKELSSADNVVDFHGTVELLRKHRLLLDQTDSTATDQELIR